MFRLNRAQPKFLEHVSSNIPSANNPQTFQANFVHRDPFRKIKTKCMVFLSQMNRDRNKIHRARRFCHDPSDPVVQSGLLYEYPRRTRANPRRPLSGDGAVFVGINPARRRKRKSWPQSFRAAGRAALKASEGRCFYAEMRPRRWLRRRDTRVFSGYLLLLENKQQFRFVCGYCRGIFGLCHPCTPVGIGRRTLSGISLGEWIGSE